MTEAITPKTDDQVVEAVQQALTEKTPLEVMGAGSKRGYGRPCGETRLLDLSELSGIGLYEPEELVMTAKAGTSIAVIEAALAENRQHLAFEPADLGPLLGGQAGKGTIGGAFACNLSGPGRILAGSARDHILGFSAVSGRGEAIKSGGRVVKNVTGFDLSKLMVGSFGTLAVISEVTFKVLPAPEQVRTVLVSGAQAETAVAIMTKALQSPYEVSGAAHLPPAAAAASTVPEIAGPGGPMTLIRVAGPEPSVEYRCRALGELFRDLGQAGELDDAGSRLLWREIRDVSFFAGSNGNQVWRLSVPPGEGPGVAERLSRSLKGRLYFDWGGGLIWLEMEPRPDGGHNEVRQALNGGHATLIRAAEEVRGGAPVFHPQPGPLAALNARIKESFDPQHILNPGRMVKER